MNLNFIFFSISSDFESFHRRREIEEIAKLINDASGRVIYFKPPKFLIRGLWEVFHKENKKNKKNKKNNIHICNLFTLMPLSWILRWKLLMFGFVTLPIMLQVWYIKKLYLKPIKTVTWFYKPDQYLYLKYLRPYIYLHYDNYECDENYHFNKNKDFDSIVSSCVTNSLLTLVCSYKLYNLYKIRDNNKVYYYPNAISRELLQHSLSSSSEVKGKTIGFIGQLDNSFDVELLEKIAKHFSNYKLMLIGEVRNSAIFEMAIMYTNIELLGYISYENLSSKIKTFTVGICPYKENDFNQYRNPLKILEYFSYGLPVVSVECDMDKKAKCMARIASGHDEFLDLLNQELQFNSADKVELRKSFMQNNCWDNRVSFVLNEVTKKIAL